MKLTDCWPEKFEPGTHGLLFRGRRICAMSILGYLLRGIVFDELGNFALHGVAQALGVYDFCFGA